MMNIAFDVTGITIETERLLLRPFADSDLGDFNAYASVPGVGEAAGWPHHESMETSKGILDSFLKDKNNFAIFHKADGKVIGSLGLHGSWSSEDDYYNHLKAIEPGYVLSKDYWGQGLVTEALKAVLDYGFKNLDIDAFGICHFVENTKSQRIIEKCGFTYVKPGVFHSRQLKKDFDDLKYILLRPPAFEVREIIDSDDKGRICNDILRALPDWFGIESSIVEYVNQVRTLPFYVMYDKEKPVGFVAILPHNPHTAEVCVMGILQEYHRRGIGKTLIAYCERYCICNKMEFLTVKTLDESYVDASYAMTRKFYHSVGFKPLEVFTTVWAGCPCLLMIKHISGGGA